MNPIEYVESVKERLSTDSIVISFDVIREFASLEEGFIRARANLTNGDILDFSEFVQWLDDLELISYRYQWMDKDKNLVRRWDNAKHFSDLENFPHHVHVNDKDVISGKPINIFEALDEIAAAISK
jgi:hypothetical protein